MENDEVPGSNRENKTNLNVRAARSGQNGENNFDEQMLRQINRKGKEKSVTFKDQKDAQIMSDQYAVGNGGRLIDQNVVNTGSAGSGGVNMLGMSEEELNNLDRGADGNNRDRASTMDLKSNQGGR